MTALDEAHPLTDALSLARLHRTALHEAEDPLARSTANLLASQGVLRCPCDLSAARCLLSLWDCQDSSWVESGERVLHMQSDSVVMEAVNQLNTEGGASRWDQWAENMAAIVKDAASASASGTVPNIPTAPSGPTAPLAPPLAPQFSAYTSGPAQQQASATAPRGALATHSLGGPAKRVVNNVSFQTPWAPPAAPVPSARQAPQLNLVSAQEQWMDRARGPAGGAHPPAPIDLANSDDLEEAPDSPGNRAASCFQTAGTILHAEQARKRKLAGGGGGGPPPGAGDGAGYRGPGLPRKRLGSVAATRSGFIPPYLKKAMEDGGQAAGGAKAPAGGAKGSAPEGEAESPYSESAQALLLGADGAMPEMILKLEAATVNTICNEIIDSSGGVQWDDIAGSAPAGQQHAKALVQELVVWPMQNPDLFTGARAPPKGLLLFGPPGTGKTLIGKAIASNIQATFFSISASSLTSKWIGESEKLVRALFAVAEVTQPSVIFIDEVDSILSARKSDGEHEASRRLKTELLIQMEGCDPNSANRRVLLIGATNRPEELDEAARRRMPKQLYIPLPCGEARLQMILRQIGEGGGVRATLSDAEVAKVVEKTAGYSGSDMKALIQEACQGPVRDAVRQHAASVSGLRESDLRAVMLKDFKMACQQQKASVKVEEVKRYVLYDELHGARRLLPVEDDMDEDEW